MSDATVTPNLTQSIVITQKCLGLKILGLQQWAVPVQVRPGAPLLNKFRSLPLILNRILNRIKWSHLESFAPSFRGD